MVSVPPLPSPRCTHGGTPVPAYGYTHGQCDAQWLTRTARAWVDPIGSRSALTVELQTAIHRCGLEQLINTRSLAAVRASSPIPPAVISSTVWCSSPAGLVATTAVCLVPSLVGGRWRKNRLQLRISTTARTTIPCAVGKSLRWNQAIALQARSSGFVSAPHAGLPSKRSKAEHRPGSKRGPKLSRV